MTCTHNHILSHVPLCTVQYKTHQSSLRHPGRHSIRKCAFFFSWQDMSLLALHVARQLSVSTHMLFFFTFHHSHQWIFGLKQRKGSGSYWTTNELVTELNDTFEYLCITGLKITASSRMTTGHYVKSTYESVCMLPV